MKRSVSLIGLLAIASFAPVAAADPTCHGLPVTITATATMPVVQGTAGADVVDARALQAGVIELGAGDDTVCLGDGPAYVVHGGEGRDTVSYEYATTILIANLEGRAGAGDEGEVVRIPRTVTSVLTNIVPTVSASDVKGGKDVLAQTEVFVGSPQTDVITGRLLEPDEIYGGDGDDIITGLFGNDRLFGGAGNDTLTGDGVDEVTYDPIREQKIGPVTKPSFATDDDYLDGGPGQDGINDETGKNTMLGGPGSDAFSHGNNDDVIDGGPGRDVLSFADNAVTLDLNITAPQNTGSGVDTIRGIEDVLGSPFDDTIIGTPGENIIRGQGGDDRIAGSRLQVPPATWDTLDGGAGDDACWGATQFNCELSWTPPAP